MVSPVGRRQFLRWSAVGAGTVLASRVRPLASIIAGVAAGCGGASSPGAVETILKTTGIDITPKNGVTIKFTDLRRNSDNTLTAALEINDLPPVYLTGKNLQNLEYYLEIQIVPPAENVCLNGMYDPNNPNPDNTLPVTLTGYEIIDKKGAARNQTSSSENQPVYTPPCSETTAAIVLAEEFSLDAQVNIAVLKLTFAVDAAKTERWNTSYTAPLQFRLKARDR